MLAGRERPGLRLRGPPWQAAGRRPPGWPTPAAPLGFAVEISSNFENRNQVSRWAPLGVYVWGGDTRPDGPVPRTTRLNSEDFSRV